jgi:hypothetical protein
MPRVMPMTAAISPTFAARYPEASIIFDNLHSMHDVVSDILANPTVPRGEKRARIMEAARRYRDETSYVMTAQQWRDMAQMMGVENMGGPAVGFLAEFPTPTVERGAVMAGMDHSKMNVAGVLTDSARADSAAAMDHAKMGHAMPGDSAALATARVNRLMELHMRMMEDSLIRLRVMADTAMRRMMTELMDDLPAEHRSHMESMMREAPRPATPAPSPVRREPLSQRRTQPDSATPATKPAPSKPAADPHAGHRMPPAMPPTRTPAKPATPGSP